MAHQIDGWNSEPLGGIAVAGLHFLSGENVHGFMVAGTAEMVAQVGS
jgi:hypothetical protein